METKSKRLLTILDVTENWAPTEICKIIFDYTKQWDAYTAQCIHVFHGHTRPVLSLLALLNGQFASGSVDNTIKIWDMYEMKCITTLKGHGEGVTVLISGPKKNQIISGSHDNLIKLWDLKTNSNLLTLVGHEGGITSLLLYSNNKLISGSKDKRLFSWNLEEEDPKPHEIWGYETSIYAITKLPKKQIAVSTGDWDVDIWNMEKEIHVFILSGHKKPVGSLLALPNHRLLSGSDDGDIRIWDYRTGECLEIISYGSFGPIHSLLSFDDLTLMISSESGLHIWDLEKNRYVRQLKEDSNKVFRQTFSNSGLLTGESRALALAILTDGELVYSCEKLIALWASS